MPSSPSDERRLFARRPADILITTPESLFLLLTSAARAALTDVETVIVDEVHAVAGTKRGVHLALSLERLDALLPRPAHRAVRHRAAGRRGGPLPRRRPRGGGCSAAGREDCRDPGGGAGRGHVRSWGEHRRSPRRRICRRAGGAQLDLAGDRTPHC